MSPTQPSPPAHRRRLMVLVIAVLAVHLWLLSGTQPWFRPGPTTAPHAPQASLAPVTPTVLTRAVPMASATAETLTAVVPALAPAPKPQPVLASQASPKQASKRTAPIPPRPEKISVKTEVSAATASSSATELTATVTLPAAAGALHAAPQASPQAAHDAPVRVPESRRLNYDVSGEAKGFPYRARAELLWRHEGTGYNARLEIAAMLIGSRVQTSVGLVTAEGLAPQRFSDKLRSEVAAHFERDKGKVSFSANTPDVPLSPGAQDRLSVLLQLSSLLAGAPQRYAPGSVIAMQTIGPRDADDWHFVVGPEERLSLADGTHNARKLSREPKREFDLRVDVWLAADLGYLPVQLKMTQPNGDFVQLQLKSTEAP